MRAGPRSQDSEKRKDVITGGEGKWPNPALGCGIKKETQPLLRATKKVEEKFASTSSAALPPFWSLSR